MTDNTSAAPNTRHIDEHAVAKSARDAVDAETSRIARSVSLVAGVAMLFALAVFGASVLQRNLEPKAGSPPAIMSGGDIAPFLNTAGDTVFNSAYISDGTGTVQASTDGGVAKVISGAPLTLGKNDGSGCITFSATTGLFTIASRCGVGTVHLEACVSKASGANNTAATNVGEWLQNGTAITTQNTVFKTETVDAGGTTTANVGCSIAEVDAALTDTFGFAYVTGGATADTVTTKQFYESIRKIVNK